MVMVIGITVTAIIGAGTAGTGAGATIIGIIIATGTVATTGDRLTPLRSRR
jgi:hypothetical protein